MSPHTDRQYRAASARCRALFAQKALDYGLSWAVMRPPALTDQLLIKARRLRTLDQTGVNRVGEAPEGEYIGLVNYALMALLVLDPEVAQQLEQADYRLGATLSHSQLLAHYDAKAEAVYALFLRKNHDYGEAWRDMRLSSYIDIILMRLQRIREIEDQGGLTRVSEGIDANLMDIVNYALFALIRLEESGAATG